MSPNPTGVIDYGQYDAKDALNRRIDTTPNTGGPVYPHFAAPKPADTIQISLEFLRGVEAAAQWAHDNHREPFADDIIKAVTAEEVERLRKEAAK